MKSDLDKALEEIYEAYPRHVAKRAALKAIHNALVRLHDGETGEKLDWQEAINLLWDTASLYAASPAGQRGPFTPHATTWFNQARYLDDPKEWERGSEPQQQNGVSEGWLQ